MKLKLRELTVFAILAALMFASKQLMAVLPNIHLLGVIIVAVTVVYRAKALYPIYTYVIIEGLFSGFATWWIPYLYVWTILWAVTMILPKKIPAKIKPLVYMTVCGLHGVLFGVLYAPAQAIMFGMSFKATVSWIAAGLPFDLIHGASNFVCGLLIVPVVNVLKKFKN